MEGLGVFESLESEMNLESILKEEDSLWEVGCEVRLVPNYGKRKS